MALDHADELLHTPENDPNWRESLAFCFHDNRGRIGGVTKITIWPRRKRGEGFAAIFQEAGQTLCRYVQVPLDTLENGAPSASNPLRRSPGATSIVIDFSEVNGALSAVGRLTQADTAPGDRCVGGDPGANGTPSASRPLAVNRSSGTTPSLGNSANIDGALAVPGMGYTMLAPFREWRLAVQADFRPRAVLSMSHALDEPAAGVPVQLALNFHALGPVYEYPATPGLSTATTRRYEQSGHMLGRIVVDGKLYNVAGLGSRSHSWGRRSLTLAEDRVVICAQFDAHLALNIRWGRHAGQEVAGGTILTDRRNLPVVSAAMTVIPDAPSGRPQSVQVKARTADGRTWQLGGTVKAVQPILLPRGTAPQHLYACSTRFRHNGLSGYGMLTVARPARDNALLEG